VKVEKKAKNGEKGQNSQPLSPTKVSGSCSATSNKLSTRFDWGRVDTPSVKAIVRNCQILGFVFGVDVLLLTHLPSVIARKT
jgi:hypothetical protein